MTQKNWHTYANNEGMPEVNVTRGGRQGLYTRTSICKAVRSIPTVEMAGYPGLSALRVWRTSSALDDRWQRASVRKMLNSYLEVLRRLE